MNQAHTINIRGNDDLVVIEVQGDLNTSAERDMDDAYKKACDYNAKKILIKFDGKSRMNSAGIANIIDLVIKSQEKHRIFIAGVSKHFQKIFELVGLTKYTTIVESEEEVSKV